MSISMSVPWLTVVRVVPAKMLREQVEGQFTCVCGEGYEGGGVNTPCIDIDECIGVDCGPTGTCEENEGEVNAGQYTCTCEAGYAGGVNTPCADIDECAGVDCGPSGVCRHAVGEAVVGQFTCDCG